MKRQRSGRIEIAREEQRERERYRADRRKVNKIQRRVEQRDKRFFSPVDAIEGEYDIYINGIRAEPGEYGRAVERAATGRKGRGEAKT